MRENPQTTPVQAAREALIADGIPPYGGCILAGRCYFAREPEPDLEWLMDALAAEFPLCEFRHDYLTGSLFADRLGKTYVFRASFGVPEIVANLQFIENSCK